MWPNREKHCAWTIAERCSCLVVHIIEKQLKIQYALAQEIHLTPNLWRPSFVEDFVKDLTLVIEQILIISHCSLHAESNRHIRWCGCWQTLTVGVRQLRVMLDDVELFRGELSRGCGNKFFDYCHKIPLVPQQTADSSRLTLAVDTSVTSSQDKSSTSRSSSSGKYPVSF